MVSGKYSSTPINTRSILVKWDISSKFYCKDPNTAVYSQLYFIRWRVRSASEIGSVDGNGRWFSNESGQAGTKLHISVLTQYCHTMIPIVPDGTMQPQTMSIFIHSWSTWLQCGLKCILRLMFSFLNVTQMMFLQSYDLGRLIKQIKKTICLTLLLQIISDYFWFNLCKMKPCSIYCTVSKIFEFKSANF